MIGAYLALLADEFEFVSRIRAINGVDPSRMIEEIKCLRSVCDMLEVKEKALGWGGLSEIDINATLQGIRARLVKDETLDHAKLFECGQVLNTAFVALNQKQKALENAAE